MIVGVKPVRHTSLRIGHYYLGIALCLIVVIAIGLYWTNNRSPFVYDVGWSPDGTRVVSTCHYPAIIERLAVSVGWNGFSADFPYQPVTTEICVTDAKSGNEQRLTHNDWPDYDPLWSPDGNHLAYISDHGDNPQIYLIEIDTQQERVLAQTEGVNEINWSPDGKHLAFSRNGSDANGEWSGSIYAVEIETGEIQQIFKTKGIISSPSWSPDGKKIAFTVDDQQRNVYVLDLGTRDQIMSSFEIPALAKPAWSTDAAQLAFWDKSSPNTDTDVTLAAFNIKTQTTHTIGGPVIGWGPLSWSPNNDYIYGIVDSQAMKIAIEGNAWAPITNYQGGTVQDLVLSPDSAQLAFSYWSLDTKHAEIRFTSTDPITEK